LKVGILGYNDYAAHELQELANYSKNLSLYTNGNKLEMSDENKKKLSENHIIINEKKIKKFCGEDNLFSIEFEDDTTEKLDGIFIAYGTASSIDFARKLGVIVNKDKIIVDKEYRTNICGLYAAGDCTGGFKQISVAVGQGAIAGQNMVEYIRSLEK
jgi:thioredoxin reductase (NADPH)